VKTVKLSKDLQDAEGEKMTQTMLCILYIVALHPDKALLCARTSLQAKEELHQCIWTDHVLSTEHYCPGVAYLAACFIATLSMGLSVQIFNASSQAVLVGIR